MRSQETRDVSEELNSRAQSERQGIVNESDVGYSAQLSQQNVQRLRDIYEGDLLLWTEYIIVRSLNWNHDLTGSHAV